MKMIILSVNLPLASLQQNKQRMFLERSVGGRIVISGELWVWDFMCIYLFHQQL